MTTAAVQVGARVSVAEVRFADITTGAVQRATVTEVGEDHFTCRVHVVGPNLCFRRFDDEGTLWCRGWKGQAVDALRATAVMK